MTEEEEMKLRDEASPSRFAREIRHTTCASKFRLPPGVVKLLATLWSLHLQSWGSAFWRTFSYRFYRTHSTCQGECKG
jgi:hypothetical protein